jgi:hypothetical protein
MKALTPKLVAVAGAGLAVAGGGAAIAATQFGDPKAESQAIIDDAAGQLGIEPSKLSDALKKALENRVDAAVAAGRLTQAEGDALKARIAAGDVPIFGHVGGPRGHLGPFGRLDAAASYLGLTEVELRTQLSSGKTLAQVAEDRGKSADGLVQALLDDAKEKLDDAVAAGRLTQAEADSMLEGLEPRIEDLVNTTRGEFFEGRRRFGGPPPFALPGA